MALTVDTERPAGLAEEIEFIPESERAGSPRTLAGAWSGVLVAPGTLVTGIVAAGGAKGPGFSWAAIGLTIGIMLGAAGVAWISTFGPPWGLGTMTIGSFAFGWANVAPIVALLFSLACYNALTDNFAASALDDAFGIPFVFAVAGVFVLEVGVIAFRERIMRVGGIAVTAGVLVVVAFALYGIFDQGVHPYNGPADNPNLAGQVLTAIALGLSMSITWGVQACDLSRTLPAKTSRRSVLVWVFLGMSIPLIALGLLGAYVSTAQAINDPLGRLYDVIGGGLIADGALIVLCFSFVLANGLNDYSAGLGLQNIGVPVSRVFGSLIFAFFALSLAFVFHLTPLGSLTSDVLLIAGYYTVCWFGVVIVELWLRRSEASPWVKSPVSPGAALAAFIGALLILLPFSATSVGNQIAADSSAFAWVGIVSRELLSGGGLGYEAGAIASALLYGIFRSFTVWRSRRQKVDGRFH